MTNDMIAFMSILISAITFVGMWMYYNQDEE